jgi:hypothetical protein
MAHRAARGVTLVEIVLALVMFVIAGGGLVGAHLYSHQLAESATHTMRAVDDGEDLMEHIRATAFDVLLARFPAGVPDGGATDYATLVGGYTLDGQQIVVTYPSQTPGRLEVLVTVTWVERLRPRAVTLSTVRTGG